MQSRVAMRAPWPVHPFGHESGCLSGKYGRAPPLRFVRVGGTTAGSANRRQLLPARSLRHIAIYITKRSALRAGLTRALRLPIFLVVRHFEPEEGFQPFRAAIWLFRGGMRQNESSQSG